MDGDVGGRQQREGRVQPVGTRAWRRFGGAIARPQSDNKLPKLVLGGNTVWMKGVTRFDLRDSYHNVIGLSWPRFLLTVVALHLAINMSFALLYLAQPASVANARPGSLADAFFFSVETSATVGYGEMYPATLYAHAICTVEIMVGMAFTALMTGLFFVRFSRPKAQIRFAQNAAIASHRGEPTLMIRIANGRSGILYDAVVHLNLVLVRRGDEGRMTRQIYELRLARSRAPIFALTWTLMHKIDATSPLHDCDAARLAEQGAVLLLGVEARDTTVSAQVADTKVYESTQILFGMRYVDAMSFDADGHPVADLSAVGQLERDIGPEPAVAGWQE